MGAQSDLVLRPRDGFGRSRGSRRGSSAGGLCSRRHDEGQQAGNARREAFVENAEDFPRAGPAWIAGAWVKRSDRKRTVREDKNENTSDCSSDCYDWLERHCLCSAALRTACPSISALRATCALWAAAIGQSAIAFCRCAAFSYLQPNSSLLRAGLLVWLPPKQLPEHLPAAAVGVHGDGNLDKRRRAKIP